MEFQWVGAMRGCRAQTTGDACRPGEGGPSSCCGLPGARRKGRPRSNSWRTTRGCALGSSACCWWASDGISCKSQQRHERQAGLSWRPGRGHAMPLVHTALARIPTPSHSLYARSTAIRNNEAKPHLCHNIVQKYIPSVAGVQTASQEIKGIGALWTRCQLHSKGFYHMLLNLNSWGELENPDIQPLSSLCLEWWAWPPTLVHSRCTMFQFQSDSGTQPPIQIPFILKYMYVYTYE